jgi:hypothetical protein
MFIDHVKAPGEDGLWSLYQEGAYFWCELMGGVAERLALETIAIEMRIGFPCEGRMEDFVIQIEDGGADIDLVNFEQNVRLLIQHTIICMSLDDEA